MPNILRVTFQDDYDQTVTRQYTFAEDNPSTAAALAGALLGSLDLVTDAKIVRATITNVLDVSALKAVPVDNGHPISVNATLNAYITATKTAVISIPSPDPALFVPNTAVVDINYAQLGALFADLAPNVLVSDGESIDDTLGVNGLRNGVLTSRPRRGK